MPIYEYKCNKCGHEYELIQKMSEPPNTECERCHENFAQRLVSAAGFQLKGTGWYATDFKNKGKPKPLTEDKSNSAESAATSAPKDTTNKGEDK